MGVRLPAPAAQRRDLRGIVQAQIDGIARLSDSLRLQRADRGNDPAVLSRSDIVASCNRLAYQLEQRVLTAAARRRTHYAVKGCWSGCGCWA